MPFPDPALPIIDLAGIDTAGPHHRDPARSAAIAAEIQAACTSVGFFYIRNHGVPDAIITQMRAVAKAFFTGPNAVKHAASAVNHRGYIGFGGARMQGATRPDDKESFVFGLERAAGDPEEGLPLRGRNVWPTQPPSLRDIFIAYDAALAACGRALLGAVALSLGQRQDFFDGLYQHRLARHNVIHYPPHRPDSAADQFGGAAHTDYGVITLLWQDENGGLEVQPRGREGWIAADPVPGTLVVNIGDLLERWSNGRFVSNPHRVVNRSGQDRYSIATFYDCDYAVMTDPRDFAAGQAAKYPPIGAGDYILRRVQDSFGSHQPGTPINPSPAASPGQGIRGPADRAGHRSQPGRSSPSGSRPQ